MGSFNSTEGEIVDNRDLLNNAIFPNYNVSDLTQEQRESQFIQVFTMNVANFQYVPEWARRSQEISGILSSLKPDYMAFQELCSLQMERKNALADILKGVDFIWYTVWKLASVRKSLNIVTQSKEGVGAVSRYSISRREVYTLPQDPNSKDKQNQRLLVLIRTAKKGKIIDFATTHLSLDDAEAMNQLSFIRATLNDLYKQQDPKEYCQILSGDFNLANAPDFNNLLSKADGFADFQDVAVVLQQEVPTFPSTEPSFRLDRIFFRGLSFTPTEISVQPAFDSSAKITSDHLYLTAKFNINSPVPLFRLTTGQSLEQGMVLSSDSRFYSLFIASDWNIVIYKSLVWTDPKNILWKLLDPAALSTFTPPCFLKLQEDGNVVYADSKDKVLWTTNTWGQGYGPWTLLISQEGQVRYQDSDSKSLWVK